MNIKEIKAEILKTIAVSEQQILKEQLEPSRYQLEAIEYHKGVKAALSGLYARIAGEPLQDYWVMCSPFGHYIISTSGFHSHEAHTWVASYFTEEVAEEYCLFLNKIVAGNYPEE